MTKKILTGQSLSNYEKLKLTGLIIKAITGVVGTAIIISENHPYLAVIVLSIGAAANEVVSYLKDKEANI
jgi:hypothetical protein